MKITNKFILETLDGENTGHQCPKCGNQNSFAYYIDSETLKPLYSFKEIGKCSREDCGYDYDIKMYIKENSNIRLAIKERMILSSEIIESNKPYEPSYLDMKHLIESENNFDKNNFVQYLYSHYPKDEVNDAVKKYRLGTSDYWKGANIFWYLDEQKNLCGGKVMQYSKSTGKRTITKGIAKIKLMDSILREKKLIDENFVSVNGFFGGHLLEDKETRIGLVESEKTAVIASIMDKSFIWLATGGRNKLTKERLEVLKDREVILYPDNDSFDEWVAMAQEFKFKTSSMVKDYCHEENADIADFYERLNYHELTLV